MIKPILANTYTHNKLTLFIIIFIVLVLSFLWDDILRGNEAQTLANVYELANPDWIPDDWFLSLDTTYRYTFNIIFYPLAGLIHFSVLAILLRLLLISITSLALTHFLSNFKLSLLIIIPLVFITFKMKGLMADEDMLWHIETKAVSYSCVIFGLSFLLQEKIFKMWISIGLSTTFHPLVGGYAVFSLIVIFILSNKNTKMSIIKKSPIFFIFAAPGLFSIIYNIMTRPENLSAFYDLLYVARHPHHMNPLKFIRYKHRILPSWIDLPLIIGNICFCVSVLVIALLKAPKKSVTRILSFYAAGSAIIWLLGFLAFQFKQYHLLKYYPFRFSDVIVPFIAYVIFALFIESLKNRYKCKILAGFTVAVVILFIGTFTIQTHRIVTDNVDLQYTLESQENIELYSWIRENTKTDSTFIIPPYIDNFYFTAERAQFVSIKNVPQNEKDLGEWYRRLIALNKNKDLYEELNLNTGMLYKNYFLLDDTQLSRIANTYQIHYYIGRPNRAGNLTQVFSNSQWAIYSIDNSIK
jgi:hypothetical protein